MKENDFIKRETVQKENCLFLKEDGYVCFKITVTEKEKAFIKGEVEEISSWDAESNAPIDFEHYLKFYIKWDGCGHVWFGDKDGYLHLCGSDAWQKHLWLMAELWKLAASQIDFDSDMNLTELSLKLEM